MKCLLCNPLLILQFHVAVEIGKHSHREIFDDNPYGKVTIVFLLMVPDNQRTRIAVDAILQLPVEFCGVVTCGKVGRVTITQSAVVMPGVIGELRAEVEFDMLNDLKEQRTNMAVKFIDALDSRQWNARNIAAVCHTEGEQIGGKPIVVCFLQKFDACVGIRNDKSA